MCRAAAIMTCVAVAITERVGSYAARAAAVPSLAQHEHSLEVHPFECGLDFNIVFLL
jgi:hypothetical protein